MTLSMFERFQVAFLPATVNKIADKYSKLDNKGTNGIVNRWKNQSEDDRKFLALGTITGLALIAIGLTCVALPLIVTLPPIGIAFTVWGAISCTALACLALGLAKNSFSDIADSFQRDIVQGSERMKQNDEEISISRERQQQRLQQQKISVQES